MLTTATNRQLLKLLQICDSNFPIGAFSHSYGMETYLRDEWITNRESFEEYIKAFLKGQFIYSDGLAIRLVYEALSTQNLEKLWEIDQLITVQTMARETREGTKRVGRQMLQLILDLYDNPILEIYQKRIAQAVSYGHPALVFAIAVHTMGISEKDAILSYSFSTVSSLVQNGVRAIPLGQRDGQIILRDISEFLIELYEAIKNLEEEDFGMTIPGLEIAQMRHETLHFRLFMS